MKAEFLARGVEPNRRLHPDTAQKQIRDSTRPWTASRPAKQAARRLLHTQTARLDLDRDQDTSARGTAVRARFIDHEPGADRDHRAAPAGGADRLPRARRPVGPLPQDDPELLALLDADPDATTTSAPTSRRAPAGRTTTPPTPGPTRQTPTAGPGDGPADGSTRTYPLQPPDDGWPDGPSQDAPAVDGADDGQPPPPPARVHHGRRAPATPGRRRPRQPRTTRAARFLTRADPRRP